MSKQLVDLPVIDLQVRCQVSQGQSLIARKLLTATTSMLQIARLHLRAV